MRSVRNERNAYADLSQSWAHLYSELSTVVVLSSVITHIIRKLCPNSNYVPCCENAKTKRTYEHA